MVGVRERNYHHRKWTSRRRPPNRPRRLVLRPDSHSSWTNFSGPVNDYDGLTTTDITDATVGIAGIEDNLRSYTLNDRGAPLAVTRQALPVGTASSDYLDDDGTGTITEITHHTAAGTTTLACIARFDPWGQPTNTAPGAAKPGTSSDPATSNVCTAGTTDSDKFYRAERRDNTTGTYQLGPRTYDPARGAFLSADTYRSGSPADDASIVTDPLTANRYTYVNGDPLNFTDPSGHRPITCSFDDVRAAFRAPNCQLLQQTATQASSYTPDMDRGASGWDDVRAAAEFFPAAAGYTAYKLLGEPVVDCAKGSADGCVNTAMLLVGDGLGRLLGKGLEVVGRALAPTVRAGLDELGRVVGKLRRDGAAAESRDALRGPSHTPRVAATDKSASVRSAEEARGGAAGAWRTIREHPTDAIVRQIGEESCGAACASTLLGRESVSQADIGLEAMTPERLASRMNALSSGGWTGGFVDANQANLEALSSRGPWISLLDPEAELGHFAIVDEVGAETVGIRDPRGVAYEMTHSDFLDLWSDRAGFGGAVFQ